MAQDIVPAPVSRDLLPPLLACLPLAFLSPRPPPALLSLLTPILRQRVSLLSNKSTSDSWLALLSWDREAASKLPEAIETIQIEPHPVSGEVEIEDPELIEYRRLDHETVHARLHLPEFNLLATYLWCMGETKEWLLSELRTLEDAQDATEWYATMKEADVAANPRPTAPAALDRRASRTKTPLDGDNDSAYWAAYDATPEPGRTPMKRSPAPGYSRTGSVDPQVPASSELEYFSRYMNEVQPALDPDDPDEEGIPETESTLKGNALQLPASTQSPAPVSAQIRPGSTSDDQIERFFAHRQPEDQDPALSPSTREQSGQTHLAMQHPRPSSSSSSGSVARLERKASIAVQAEIAVKQHISTDIKSLFRLARAAGIDRSEFERIVKTELDVLAMMDVD